MKRGIESHQLTEVVEVAGCCNNEMKIAHTQSW